MIDKSKALNFILLFLILYILKVGQSIILPFVVALFLWCLIYILTTNYTKFFVEKLKLPIWTRYIARLLAIITLAGIIYFIVIGIKSNIDDVSKTFGHYQKNMGEIFDKFQSYFGLKNKITFSSAIRDIDIAKIINSIVQGVAGFVQSSMMVFIYLFFILLEEKSFSKKIPQIFSSKKKEKDAKALFEKVYSKIEVYVSVKMFTSLLTGILTYIVMKSVHLDFAVFWAILIFLFNFIPTIGSIISSTFPILLSILQFNGDLLSISVVTIGIVSIQLLIGNIIDPKIMGRRLNLSPLVLILSLVFWGSMWGVVGMFLCVPIMIILTIVLLQFPSTKKFAMLLTEDGTTF
ncbi:MAG: AI-2E family transporter [bacterium]|nr:AI-2E family transporter [bacterium]